MTSLSLASPAGAPHPIEIGGRKYLMRLPSRGERIQYRHALVASGAAWHPASALCDAMDLAMDSCLPPNEAAAAHDAIALWRGANESYGRLLAEADEADMGRADIVAARAELAETARAADRYSRLARARDSDYAAMLADNAVYWEMAGILAARMFLMGWEGIDAEFPSTSEAAAELVPDGDLVGIGLGFDGMTRLAPAKRKNLDTASPGSGAAPISG